MKKYLGLVIAAGAAWYLLTRYSVGKNARFYFKRVSIKNRKIELQIAVQNPTSTSIKLNSLAGEIYANEKLVSNVSTFTPVDIPGNSEVVLTFNIVPNVAGVFNLVKNLVTSVVKKEKNVGLTIRLDGTANVDRLAVPINITYKV